MMARQSKKELYWRDVVGRWQRSKQTIRSFCDAHGLSEQSFYAWRRTIAERDQHRSAEIPDFVPVYVAPAAAAPALEVVAGPERVVRVPTGFDADTLRRLLAVLKEEPLC
jgi:hypothetical protein